MNSTFPLISVALFRAALLCGALSACGGGAEAPTPVNPPAPPPVVAPPAPAPAPVLAYLLRSDKVEVCQVDSDDFLSNCVDDGGLSGFQNLYAIAVAGSHAYVLSSPDAAPSSVIHCSIGATGALSGCEKTGPTNLGAAYGLSIHGSTLYIGDSDSPMVRNCAIEPEGSLGTCSDSRFPDGLAFDVEDLRIVGTTAYVLHHGQSKLSRCEVLADGTLDGCIETAVPGGLIFPEAFAINGNYMYFANSGADKVIRCVIAGDGSLADCVNANAPGLLSPSQVAIRGSTVYISDFEVEGLTRCSAGSDGLLIGCTLMPGSAVYSIAIRP